MARRIYAVYDDEEILMDAIDALKSKGVKCVDAQTPFPVHGIEKKLNIPRTPDFHYVFHVRSHRNNPRFPHDLVHDGTWLADQHRGQAELYVLHEPAGIYSRYFWINRLLRRPWHGINIPSPAVKYCPE